MGAHVRVMNMYGRHEAVGHHIPEVLSTGAVIKLKAQSLTLGGVMSNILAVICAASRDNTPWQL